MAVVRSRLALIWETTQNIHAVTDDKAFPVGISTACHPNLRIFPCLRSLDCSLFHRILQAAYILLFTLIFYIYTCNTCYMRNSIYCTG